MFNPFDEFLTPHIDRMRPAVQSATQNAQVWGERVLARLDAIHDAVRDDPAESYRERPSTYISGPTAPYTINVPAGEWWLLESVTFIPDAVAPGGLTLGVGAGLPMWGGSHAGRPTTIAGSKVRFESGTTVRVWSEVAGTIAFQFKVERPAQTRPGIGGRPEAPASGGTVTAPEQRHFPTFNARA